MSGNVTRFARRMHGASDSWASHAGRAKQLLRGALTELERMEQLLPRSTDDARIHAKTALMRLGVVWPDLETK